MTTLRLRGGLVIDPTQATDGVRDLYVRDGRIAAINPLDPLNPLNPLNPLQAVDVAEAMVWMVSRPPHVCVDELVLKPTDQAAFHKLHRRPTGG